LLSVLGFEAQPNLQNYPPPPLPAPRSKEQA
jgi:hypothetical protein